jgi:hypothetical protein
MPTDESGFAVLEDLPVELSYLKKPAIDLAKQPEDGLLAGVANTEVFEQALRAEMAALPPAEVETRCAKHKALLVRWLEDRGGEDSGALRALWFLVGFFEASQDIIDPYADDDTARDIFNPRPVTVEHTGGLPVDRTKLFTTIVDGDTRITVQEIDRRTCEILSEQFKEPRHETVLASGETIYPQTQVGFALSHGTKNVVVRKSKKPFMDASYLLAVPGGYVSVRISNPRATFDETQYDAIVASIRIDE